MIQQQVALVAQAQLQRNTYYLTNRAGITLDGTAYDNTLLSVSDCSFEGNFGEGFVVGTVDIIIANGERFVDNGFKYQITDIWNNKNFVIKRWTLGVDTWAGCDYYYQGIIKNFNYNYGKIMFAVDNASHKDEATLPSIVCEDQSGLTDLQAQTLFQRTGDKRQIVMSDSSLFAVGELVYLTAPNGNSEYQRVKTIVGNFINFYDELIHHADYPDYHASKIEKAFRSLPEKFIGKNIPIQIGDLSGYASGEFGKTITINKKIGDQTILADSINLIELDSVGAWESGTERFFRGKEDGEYSISSDNKKVGFIVDSTATLNSDIISTTDGVDSIIVDDYTLLVWEDEDEVDSDLPELLSINIISIDSELMQLISKPSTNEIWVDRGFGGSTIQTHSSGAKIYQCAKYSAKNLLSFRERFDATSVANFYYRNYVTATTDDHDMFILSGKWGNVVDGDLSTSIELFGDSSGAVFNYPDDINFDIKFDAISDDFVVTKAVCGFKLWQKQRSFGMQDSSMILRIASPAQTTSYDLECIWSGSAQANANKTTYFIYAMIQAAEETQEDTIDTYTTYTDSKTITTKGSMNYYVKPELAATNHSLLTDDPPAYRFFGAPFKITSLIDLNKKWKIIINFQRFYEVWLKLYAMGLWLDFFLDFTQKTVVAPIKGRAITQDVVDITGDDSPSRVGDLCENPVDVLALMLTQEVGYDSATEFTTAWPTVWSYFDTLGATAAFSYGADDTQLQGWKLCEKIAADHCLAITKLRNGEIDVVNLHELYADTPVGTEINIEDDVLFIKDSSERLMNIRQTGTDLIYNDIIVKYSRNNSTNEYQKEYHLEKDYVLENSMVPPLQLSDARNRYFDGKKRTKTIESPFIYTDAEAQRKAEWEACNHACVNLWVEAVIEYSDTHKIGDVVYFVGKHNGVTLTIDHKFFIQNIYQSDSGRELEIHCKSIQGVDVIVDPDDDNIILDTGGTSLIGDDIWHDTGGTILTGDDIINDSGKGGSV